MLLRKEYSMIKRKLFQKNKVSAQNFKVLEDVDLKSVCGGVSIEEGNGAEANEFEQSTETITQDTSMSSEERLKNLVSQIQGDSITDIHNSALERHSPRHPAADMVNEVYETNSNRNLVVHATDPSTIVNSRMQEKIDSLKQDIPEPQTPQWNGSDGSFDMDNFPEAESIHVETDMGMESLENIYEELKREASTPQLAQANQDPLVSLQFLR